MTRNPLALAALASAAVPGLDPTSVRGLVARPGEPFDVALVEDVDRHRWVVRSPRDAAAAAQLEQSEPLMRLLASRLPFAVPVPDGFAQLKEGGRAVVCPELQGRPLRWAHLPAASGIAAAVGTAIAAIHNLDSAVYDEAGIASYDADTYRTRRLAELDRAAATGHVPTALLSRWEHALEEVSLWRFASRPTHGNLAGHHVLAQFHDTDDAGSGRITGVTGWEHAQVADPADDFAALVTQTSGATFDTVMEAYAHATTERPDKHLERRARLAGELHQLTGLLAAVAAGDAELVEARSLALRRLDEHAHDISLLPKPIHAPSAGVPASAGDADPDAEAGSGSGGGGEAGTDTGAEAGTDTGRGGEPDDDTRDDDLSADTSADTKGTAIPATEQPTGSASTEGEGTHGTAAGTEPTSVGDGPQQRA